MISTKHLFVVLAAVLPLALVGCVDDHDYAHHPDHHDGHHDSHHDSHHDVHHGYHAAPYPVLVTRPPPPSQPPTPGPGHWVFDDTAQSYIWVSEVQR